MGTGGRNAGQRLALPGERQGHVLLSPRPPQPQEGVFLQQHEGALPTPMPVLGPTHTGGQVPWATAGTHVPLTGVGTGGMSAPACIPTPAGD